MRVSVERIEALMSFGGKDAAPGAGSSAAMVRQQTDGVAALCAILEKQGFAYLADEVGLGKTVQALGVAAWRRHIDVDARVLVIVPREVIQRGWIKEFNLFASKIWTGPPETLGRELALHERLNDWLAVVGKGSGISLLRQPSFTRPLHATDEHKSWRSLLQNTGLELRQKWLEDEPPLNGHERSWAWNVHFARLMNKRLLKMGVRFNLVVVDEAQCLRGRNQTNEVLQTLLSGLVDKWLFVSATPAHSGIETIGNVITRYPQGCKQLLDFGQPIGDLSGADTQARLLDVLGRHMIRRVRCYDIGGDQITKEKYRRDLPEAMAWTSNDSAMGALSVALVQKRLEAIVGNAGRFQAGYLASFESLDASLETRRQRKADQATSADEDQGALAGEDDHYVDRNHREQSPAIDSAFVSQLSRRFASRFDPLTLPHPKIDAVTAALSDAAFGEGGRPGGVKTLVFCRRLSTVDTLRNRVMGRYLQWIAARVQRKWKRELDWEEGKKDADAHHGQMGDADDGQEGGPPPAETDLLRKALQPGKWLYNFRATFNDGGGNALFFEPNWFSRLCKEGGVEPTAAAHNIPKEIWAEAYAHAHRNGKRYKREQVRYLTLHALKRHGQEVFGLTRPQVTAWTQVLEHMFGDITAVKDAVISREQVDELLPIFESVWTRWCGLEEKLGSSLPGGTRLVDITTPGGREAVYWRQGLMAALTQYFRLTDSLVDLYYCAEGGRGFELLDGFLNWLNDEDADAATLRRVLVAWMKSYQMVFSSSLHNLNAEQVAAHGYRFDFLASLDPVVGVVGGGDHSRLIRQFNTPGMPWVVVATDCMREGVNLHLFCDRVMHYGVAWTAGDLEQRVGRVDRYFSLLERRLYDAAAHGREAVAAVKLDVYYPHLRDTLERHQIEVVLQKKEVADRLMGSPLQHAGTQRLAIELDALAVFARPVAVAAAQPSREQFDPRRHLRR